MDLTETATGEYWFGQRALDMKLADEISTSDEYLFRLRDEAKIFKVEVQARKKWSEKLAENIARLIVGSYEQTWFRSYFSSRFPS